MTKVLHPGRRNGLAIRKVGLALGLLLVTVPAFAASADCPQTTAALYSRIRSIGIDPQRVYRVRDASIDRPNLHLDFDDGKLAFTEDICGRITGAFFDGEGEIRLRPPNHVERGSLTLFTGMAILEEQFTSAYLRFNDDTAAALQPFLLPSSDNAEFVNQWTDPSHVLADFDSLRLLLDFSHFLPSATAADPNLKFQPLLHAHLLGKKLGAFEVFWDASSFEPLWAGQSRVKDNLLFFDIWTSFAPGNAGDRASIPANDVAVTSFRIKASVQPPTRLQASADLNLQVRSGGQRTVIFELSRYLKIEAAEADGRSVDFIQNPAIEGSHVQRKGNDLVGVVFPAALATGQNLKLHFTYAGDVLSEAGNGLLYVGERGTWYPNLGLSPAQFEMEFHYPADWTLLATGQQVSRSATDAASVNGSSTEKLSHWISGRPIPVAGFNLGKYVRAEAKAGNILVEAYGTHEVEKSFPKAKPEVVEQPNFSGARSRAGGTIVVTPPPPSPARDVQAVADGAARAIQTFSQWFGPYPYNSLALTQMPGDLSQGWPGLVFLSSFAFLSPQEQTDLRLDPVTRELDRQVLVHETAHQWWGDLVLWKTYRDQWIAEGLANYASLLMLEHENPAQFREVLDKYRRDLLRTNKDGEHLRDAGPVTLGQRLESSHFPAGYEAISYERGTWLFHMLRCMLRDAARRDTVPRGSETVSHSRNGRATLTANADEPFFRALRRIQQRYAGKKVSTQEMLQVFEEELPRSLWYEQRRKLDWFLEGWINGTAIPDLELRDIKIGERTAAEKPGGGKTVGAAAKDIVNGVLVQKDAPDDLVTAVPIYAQTSSGALVFIGEILADGAETPFRLTAPSDTRKVVVDPKQTILSAPK
jgi:Peptidase family M1 domain